MAMWFLNVENVEAKCVDVVAKCEDVVAKSEDVVAKCVIVVAKCGKCERKWFFIEANEKIKRANINPHLRGCGTK